MPLPRSPASADSLSPLGAYLREIDHTPLLAADEERRLAQRVQEGDAEARDHLVRANLRLAVRIARGYAGRGVDLADLIAEGNLGLLRAAEGFDPGMGTRFSTYASYWVEQAVQRAVIRASRPVRVPAYAAQLLRRWRRAEARLQEELGRPPTLEEVAAALGLRPRQFQIACQALRAHAGPAQSEEGGPGLNEVLPDRRGGEPGTVLGEAEELDRVIEMVGRLDARAAKVLRLRFGLEGGKPLTLAEVGTRLELTRERVRQIELAALARLREELGVNEKAAPPQRGRKGTVIAVRSCV